VPTARGPAFRIEKDYPLSFLHGSSRLCDAIDYSPGQAAAVVGQAALEKVGLDRVVFLDTETTGLAGGAGTLAFLIGIGRFTPAGFRLRQYFLRHPGEEPGLLEALRGDLETAEGFITFNGQIFDLPLLDMRFRLTLRQDRRLTAYPHLDLLHPARRLWRRILPDCTLATIEREVLQVEREQMDVPGALIPSLYLDYLRTGDATEIARVVYHNQVDILSLVSLTTHVLGRHHQDDAERLSGAEALAVARWHDGAGRPEPAEMAYQAVLSSSADESIHVEALRRFTQHLRRSGRWPEAIAGWKHWHALAPADPVPCLELAKHYEWRARNYVEARMWAEAALIALSHWEPGWRRDEMWSEIEHRLRRLFAKMDREASAG
jgi:uncharacterized protein YprB with RNaseH-like and TPR domain